MSCCKQRGHKNDKIVNNKDLPPHVVGDSGQETNNFFLLGLIA